MADPDWVYVVEMDVSDVAEKLEAVQSYVDRLGASGVKRFERIGTALQIIKDNAIQQVRELEKAYEASLKGKDTKGQMALLEDLNKARASAIDLLDIVEKLDDRITEMEPITISKMGHKEEMGVSRERLLGEVGTLGAESLIRKVDAEMDTVDEETRRILMGVRSRVSKYLEKFLDPGDNFTANKLIKRVDQESKNLDKFMKAKLGGMTIEGVDLPFDSLVDQARKAVAEMQSIDIGRQLAAMLESDVPEVRAVVGKYQDQLAGLAQPKTPITGEKYLAELRRIQSEINKIKIEKVSEQPDIFDVEQAQANGEALIRQIDNILPRADQVVRDRLKGIKEELRTLLDPQGNIQSDVLVAGVRRAAEKVTQVLDTSFKKMRISQYFEGFSVDTPLDTLNESIRRAGAEIKRTEIDKELELLFNDSNRIVRDGAQALSAKLTQMFEEPISADKLRQQVNQVVSELAKLKPGANIELINTEQNVEIDTFTRKVKELQQVTSQASKKVNEEGKEQLRHLADAAIGLENEAAKYQNVGKSVDSLVPKMNKLITSGKQIEKSFALDKVTDNFRELSDSVIALQSVEFKVNTKEAEVRLKTLRGVIKELTDSSKTGASQIGAALKVSADVIEREYREGKISLEQFNQRLNESINLAKRAGDAYDMTFKTLPDHVNKGHVSIWKLGSALDRVGVHGAGSILNVVDAIKSLGPVAIGAGVAIGSILLVVNQVMQALTELAKRAAEAFFQFTKGAIATSQAVEVTDKQLGGLIGNMDLGPAFRNLLLEKSFDVGLDLTGNFARVAVPLAASTQEILDMADAAATLAHAFQETDESIANAIKQATGGHYRPLIELFGFTNAEINNMKEAQETGTQLGGVLKGIQDFLVARGLNLDEMRSTFQVLLGQLTVVRKEIEIAFGDPVKDALARQLRDLFSLVEDNHDVIIGFFEAIGRAVGDVIEKVGDIGKDLIGDITEEDIKEFEDRLKILGGEIDVLLDKITILLGTDDKNLIDIFISLTDATTALTIELQKLTVELDKLKDFAGTIKEVNDFLKSPLISIPQNMALGGLPKVINSFGPVLRPLFEALQLAEGETLTFTDAWVAGTNAMKGALPFMGDMIDWAQEEAGVLDEATTSVEELTVANEDLGNSLQGLIDEALAAKAAAEELGELKSAAEEAAEKIAEAEDKLERDRRQQEAELNTKFARDEIVAQQKLSMEKQEMFRSHMNKMQELNFDFHADNAAALLDFDRKEEDIYTKHTDKLTDIDREEAEKKIEIEEKFRERLEDIRRRFDLQAEEAIRKNDAVSLLRIRRQMRAELEEAVINRDREIETAADTAQKKRDEAQIWLDREIRDNNLAESRKLADLITADQLKRDEMNRQFAWEQSELFKKYDEERALAKQKHDWEMEDLAETYKVKKEELQFQFADEYALQKEWMDKQAEYARLKYQELQAWFRAQRALFIREGSLARYLIDSYLGPPPSYDPEDFMPDTGGIGGRVEDDDDPYSSEGRIGGRQHGGFVTSGNYYNVGERGPERFMPVQAGLIVPHQPYMMAARNGSGYSSIDNSRHLNASIAMSDPSQMTPMQRAVIRSIIVEEILAYGL